MPRVAFESSLQLIQNSFDLSHRFSPSCLWHNAEGVRKFEPRATPWGRECARCQHSERVRKGFVAPPCTDHFLTSIRKRFQRLWLEPRLFPRALPWAKICERLRRLLLQIVNQPVSVKLLQISKLF